MTIHRQPGAGNGRALRRRDVLKGGASLSVGAASAILAETGSARAAAAPPNIVYIVADDLGWKDVGFQAPTSARRTSTAWPKPASGSSNSTPSRCARRPAPRS